MKVSNQKCRSYVSRCEDFQGSNLFGVHENLNTYVVYSYGHHFPIYANIGGVWYGNKGRYSVSTSKHQGQANPGVSGIQWVGTDELKSLINSPN